MSYVAELSLFRGKEGERGCLCLNDFVTLLSNINAKFGDDAEEQRVLIAVTDKMFETTSGFYRAQFYLFFFGFMIPFICQIFYCEDPAMVRLVTTVCMITQVAFFILEVVQMCVQGSAYIEMWNMIDVFLFFMFSGYYVARMQNTD